MVVKRRTQINIDGEETVFMQPVEIPQQTDRAMVRSVIYVQPTQLSPGFEMAISTPEDRDEEEYIDELLDRILDLDIRQQVEWDFVGERMSAF